MDNKLLKATHEGVIKIGDTDLKVAVLEEGTRLINNSAIFKAFGRSKRGRGKTEVRVPNMPAFLDANNLQPFVGMDLRVVLEKVEYSDKNEKVNEGFHASILPLLCKVYLDARAANVLKPQQLPLARASEILLLGLSNIGITALIDEATGYQYDREKDALQVILKAYISSELLPWEKRFPDDFYKEIFRLNKWDFTVAQIKYGSRPGIIGTWTKKYIYSVLPKGVLEALLNKTPRNEKGKLSKKLHQSLSREQGIEHLNKQIISVVTLMNVSDSWNDFERIWNKKFGQQEIAFKEYDLLAPKQQKPLSGFDKKLKIALDYNPKKDKKENTDNNTLF